MTKLKFFSNKNFQIACILDPNNFNAKANLIKIINLRSKGSLIADLDKFLGKKLKISNLRFSIPA